MKRTSMMRRVVLALAVVASLPSSDGAWADDDKKPPVIEDRILVTVNNEPISRRTLVHRLRLLNSYRQLELNPQIERSAQIMTGLEGRELREIIEERLIVQEAARQDLKLDKREEGELEAILERLAEPSGGVDGYKKELERIGSSIEVVRSKQKASLMIGKVYSESVSSKIFIHPRDVREYYEQNKEDFVIKARTEVRRIRLTLDSEDLTPAIEKWMAKRKMTWSPDTCKILGAELRQKLLKGENAGLVVKDFAMRMSDKRTAGLLVFTTDTEKVAEVKGVVGLKELCSKLNEGEISELREFRSRRGEIRGYQLIYLELRRKRTTIPFQRAQARISQILRRNEFSALAKAWTRELRSKADIRFFSGK